MEFWRLEYLDGMSTATTQGEVPTVPPPAPPPEDHVPEMRGQGVHAKASGSEPSGQKSAELPDARHARLPVQGSHTVVNASRIKMPGTRAAEPHQRRRRNVELLQIQKHDHWTRVEVRRIPSRRGRKRPLRKRTRTRLTRWMRTTFEEDQQQPINWNQSAMKTCRRRHEWQETFFTSVVRTM